MGLFSKKVKYPPIPKKPVDKPWMDAKANIAQVDTEEKTHPFLKQLSPKTADTLCDISSKYSNYVRIKETGLYNCEDKEEFVRELQKFFDDKGLEFNTIEGHAAFLQKMIEFYDRYDTADYELALIRQNEYIHPECPKNYSDDLKISYSEKSSSILIEDKNTEQKVLAVFDSAKKKLCGLFVYDTNADYLAGRGKNITHTMDNRAYYMTEMMGINAVVDATGMLPSGGWAISKNFEQNRIESYYKDGWLDTGALSWIVKYVLYPQVEFENRKHDYEIEKSQKEAYLDYRDKVLSKMCGYPIDFEKWDNIFDSKTQIVKDFLAEYNKEIDRRWEEFKASGKTELLDRQLADMVQAHNDTVKEAKAELQKIQEKTREMQKNAGEVLGLLEHLGNGGSIDGYNEKKKSGELDEEEYYRRAGEILATVDFDEYLKNS